MIYDEEYGSRLVRALGLAEFRTSIETFDDVPALVIERYDRRPTRHGIPERIHQEDFNQVLGLRGDEKYQRYGGHASLARAARTLTTLGNREALVRLARMTVLSVAIGNLDMHAKNVALLHHPDGTVDLAPAYDVVPQTHLPNDGELALAVDGTYRHTAITMDHLLAEGRAWGLTTAAGLAEEDTHRAVLHLASTETPYKRAYSGLNRDIAGFASNLLDGRAAGLPGAG